MKGYRKLRAEALLEIYEEGVELAHCALRGERICRTQMINNRSRHNERVGGTMEQCGDIDFSYCISCQTGMESRAAYLVHHALQINCIAPVKEKREWRGKRWERKNIALLPGYIFAYSHAKLDTRQVGGLPHIHKVLQYADGNTVLDGRDRAFAYWLMQHDGIVGLSSAVLEGNRVRVVSGPLKDLEGMIVKVDNRKQIAKVALTAGGSAKHFWLSFELIR